MACARRVATLALCFVSIGNLVVLAQSSPAMLKLDLKHPVGKASPMLYGLMTEEINFSYDGGLYAEMVRNRTFHEKTERWFLVEEGSAQAAMAIDKTTGPSDALPLSLKIDVKTADAQNQAGVLNEGYWGMSLQPNTTYSGSFYAKTDSAGLGPIAVSLVNNDTG